MRKYKGVRIHKLCGLCSTFSLLTCDYQYIFGIFEDSLKKFALLQVRMLSDRMRDTLVNREGKKNAQCMASGHCVIIYRDRATYKLYMKLHLHPQNLYIWPTQPINSVVVFLDWRYVVHAMWTFIRPMTTCFGRSKVLTYENWCWNYHMFPLGPVRQH
jgi:hypothetical protein